ncbi:YolD-like family protein [Paenibacillus macerans]|uniref:YolD-like family protein n=1 Tax=Paenibacillus macerans TaxID=44252 RepID=UPI0022E13641|nr:YolD-like family protein [Paenibacillus macerans]
MSSRLGDGLWSTKFILPEHDEALKRERKEGTRKQHPVLDDQEVEQIERAIAEAFREHRRITIRVCGECEDVELSGFITTVQTYLREIKLVIEPGEWKWIRIEDILSAGIV